MSNLRRSLRALAAALVIATLPGAASASAFEAHNYIEPSFGSLAGIGELAVDQSDGNVYAEQTQPGHEEVQVFGREGGEPTGEVPGRLRPREEFEFYAPGGLAVDPSNHDLYILDNYHHVVERFSLNSSHEYEYVCELEYYGAGNRCLADGGSASESTLPGATVGHGGVVIDAAGDIYVGGRIEGDGGIFEFNAAGEAVDAFDVPSPQGYTGLEISQLAVSSNGTIFALLRSEAPNVREVIELKRSTLTGPVEGAPAIVPHTEGASAGAESAKGIAFDRANGQLFVDLGSSGEALGEAHEVVSRFGAGVIKEGGALAVDEATGEVYVANGFEHTIDRFGPGVVATLPSVDAPPPSVSNVTRTSALLSATVATGDATSAWKLEYVAADEYKPGDANPYAGGGSTATVKLAPSVVGAEVGPVPLTGLLAGTTYHYRLVATNELGTTDGSDHTFTTAAVIPPVVTTGGASEVTQTGATLSGTVDTRELQTSYEFEVGTDASYSGAKLFGNAGSGGVEAVSAGIQFLIPGVTYHYRLVATNEDGKGYGQDMTFTTPAVPAPISQPPVESLIASPAAQFPSVVGAITKPQGSGRSKGKTKARRKAKRKKGGSTRRKRRRRTKSEKRG